MYFGLNWGCAKGYYGKQIYTLLLYYQQKGLEARKRYIFFFFKSISFFKHDNVTSSLAVHDPRFSLDEINHPPNKWHIFELNLQEQRFIDFYED